MSAPQQDPPSGGRGSSASRGRGLTETVLRGSSLSGAGWIAGQILNLAFYTALARLATPEEFGQLAAGAIAVGVGTLVAGSGMLAAVVQRRDRVDEAVNTAFLATVTGGVLLTILAVAIAPLIGEFFDDEVVGEIAAATSVWILLRAVTNVPDGLMQRRFSFLRRVVIEPMGIVAFGVTSIVLVADGMGVWGLVIGNTAQRVVVAVSAWLLAGWRPRPGLASFAMWKELIAYGRHVVAANFIARASSETNTALLGGFVGLSALGQFRYAARIAEKPLGLMVNAGSYVLFPALSRIAHDRERLIRAYRRSLRWVAAVAFPIGFVVLPLGEPLAVTLFGEPWRDAGFAAMAMFAYVGGRSVNSVTREAVKAMGETWLLPRITLVSGILTVASILALLPFGLVGVSAAVSVSAIGTVVYSLAFTERVTGLGLVGARRILWPPLAASLVMVAVMLPLEHLVIDAANREILAGLLLVAAELLLAAGVYLAALALLAPATAKAAVAFPRQAWRRLRKGRPADGEPSGDGEVDGVGDSTPPEETG